MSPADPQRTEGRCVVNQIYNHFNPCGFRCCSALVAVYSVWNADSWSCHRQSRFCSSSVVLKLYQLSEAQYRINYVDLLKVMIESTFSERGWVWTGKLIEKSVSCLTSIYFTEMRMVNEDEYESEGVCYESLAFQITRPDLDCRFQVQPSPVVGKDVPCGRTQTRLAETFDGRRRDGIRSHCSRG